MRAKKTKVFADITQDAAVVHFVLGHVHEVADVNKITSEISEILGNYKIKTLVINFARLRQVTSLFLGKLAVLKKAAAKQGVELRVCAMNDNVEQAFRICKLQKIIPVFKSEKEAISG